MSKFGSTAQFHYDAASDTLTGGTTIQLEEQDMPQYPMEEFRNTDAKKFVSKSGQSYSTRNYNNRGFVFNWTDLSESKRNELATMVDSMPILSFSSGGVDWGTFRIADDSFDSSETLFELYSVSFEVEEDN